MRAYSIWTCLSILIFIAFTSEGMACSCAPPPPPLNGVSPSMWEIAKAGTRGMDLVFEGVAERVDVAFDPLPDHLLNLRSPWGSHIVATFRPSRIYSGPHDAVFRIRTALSEPACGFDFEEGHFYLVFAQKGFGDFYTTDICTSTAAIERAGADLRFLRGEAPAPEDSMEPREFNMKMIREWTGAICGRVTLTDGSPAANADVLLFPRRREWIRNTPHETSAGTDGSFCFNLADPGQYLLGAALGLEEAGRQLRGYYPGASDAARATPVEIKASVSDPGYNIVIEERQAFKVRGRVVANSKESPPWERITVFLERTDGDLLSMAWRFDIQLGPEGVFEFENVFPGRYKLIGWVVEDKEQAADQVMTPGRTLIYTGTVFGGQVRICEVSIAGVRVPLSALQPSSGLVARWNGAFPEASHRNA